MARKASSIFGPKLNEAFRAIKRELDPGNLFNPGRIVDPPRMDDASLMRFPPTYRRIAYVIILTGALASMPALDPLFR